jgi:hypothetical protein
LNSRHPPTTSTVPWGRLLRLAETAPILKRHWDKLTPAERVRLRGLLQKSRGRRSNLTMREQLAVRRLVRKLELKTLQQELASLMRQ